MEIERWMEDKKIKAIYDEKYQNKKLPR